MARILADNRYRIVYADTGEEIADLVEADDEEGWYRVLKRGPDGEPAVTEDGRQIYTRLYGPIRIEGLYGPIPSALPRKRRRPAS